MNHNIKQVERQLYILSLLSWYQEGFTIKELYSRLRNDGIDVSLRTIRRDLDDLTLANFPIYEEKKGRSICYRLKKIEFLQAQFNTDELIGLYFLKELLYPVSSLPAIQNAYNLIIKFIEGLPQLDRKFILNLKNYFKVDYLLMDPEENVSEDTFKTLGQAILDNRVIKARYYSFYSDTVTDREIEPYHIIFKNQHYYLIGYCRKRGDVRDFRVSRFRCIALTEEHYNKPWKYSYADYVKHSWHIIKGKEIFDVEIKFTPQKARFIKEYYRHKADRLKELPDGSLLFSRRVAGLEEIIPWVLGFGGEAKVLSPPELKEAILNHLKQMQSTYSISNNCGKGT